MAPLYCLPDVLSMTPMASADISAEPEKRAARPAGAIEVSTRNGTAARITAREVRESCCHVMPRRAFGRAACRWIAILEGWPAHAAPQEELDAMSPPRPSGPTPH